MKARDGIKPAEPLLIIGGFGGFKTALPSPFNEPIVAPRNQNVWSFSELQVLGKIFSPDGLILGLNTSYETQVQIFYHWYPIIPSFTRSAASLQPLRPPAFIFLISILTKMNTLKTPKTEFSLFKCFFPALLLKNQQTKVCRSEMRRHTYTQVNSFWGFLVFIFYIYYTFFLLPLNAVCRLMASPRKQEYLFV